MMVRNQKFLAFILIICLFQNINSLKQNIHHHPIKNNNLRSPDQNQNGNAFIQTKQLFFGDDSEDDRNWKKYKWTIYELVDINVKDVMDDCEQMKEIHDDIDAWEYFFQSDTGIFLNNSEEDIKYFDIQLQGLMEAREEVFNKIDDIQNKYQEEEEVEKKEEGEDDSSIFGDLFSLIEENEDSNNEQQQQYTSLSNPFSGDIKVAPVNSPDELEINKYRNADDIADNIINFVQNGARELEMKIQISRKRMHKLHKTMLEKGKEFKDIMIQQGPLGGGKDADQLYEDLEKIFGILYDEYSNLRNAQTNFPSWEETILDLREKLHPHYDDCQLDDF